MPLDWSPAEAVSHKVEASSNVPLWEALSRGDIRFESPRVLGSYKACFYAVGSAFKPRSTCLRVAISSPYKRDSVRIDNVNTLIYFLDERWNLLFIVYLSVEEDRIRIISARKATRSERQYYED